MQQRARGLLASKMRGFKSCIGKSKLVFPSLKLPSNRHLSSSDPVMTEDYSSGALLRCFNGPWYGNQTTFAMHFETLVVDGFFVGCTRRSARNRTVRALLYVEQIQRTEWFSDRMTR